MTPITNQRKYDDDHTKAVVKMTVIEVFEGLGTDITTMEGRKEFRDNQEFISDFRSNANKAKMVTVGAVGLALLGWVGMAFMDGIKIAIRAAIH